MSSLCIDVSTCSFQLLCPAITLLLCVLGNSTNERYTHYRRLGNHKISGSFLPWEFPKLCTFFFNDYRIEELGIPNIFGSFLGIAFGIPRNFRHNYEIPNFKTLFAIPNLFLWEFPNFIIKI